MYHFVVISISNNLLRFFCLVLISTTFTVLLRIPTETSLRVHVIRFQVTGVWFVVKTIVSTIFLKKVYNNQSSSK